MKKFFIYFMATVFVASILFTGISCKEETAPVGESASAEEQEQSVVEEQEEESTKEEEASEEDEVVEEKPFEGVTIRALTYDYPEYQPMLKYIPEIKEKYGINFEIEMIPEGSMADKMWLALSTGSGEYDIVYFSPSWKGEMISEGYIVPITEYIEKYGVDPQGWLTMEHGVYSGSDDIWAIPFIVASYYVQYRKDLFTDPDNQAEFKEIYGYDLESPYNPSTDEFFDYAEYFTNHNDEVDYGFYWQMGADAWKWLWMHFVLKTFGVEWWDEGWNATIDSPEALEALKWAKEFQDFIPDGALQGDMAGTNSAIREGQVAMAVVFQSQSMESLDPEVTEFHDDWGYCLVPHAPDKDYGKWILGGGGFAVTADSPNPEAAFVVSNYLFGDDERAKEMALAGGPMNRASVFKDPEVIATFPEGAEEILEINADALKYTSFDRISIAPGAEIREQLAILWGDIVTDAKSIEEALSTANDNINEILGETMR